MRQEFPLGQLCTDYRLTSNLVAEIRTLSKYRNEILGCDIIRNCINDETMEIGFMVLLKFSSGVNNPYELL